MLANAGGDGMDDGQEATMALRPISRVDGYTFPNEGWDVRGWEVRTAESDEKVGKVEDLLLDGSGSLRYLEVDLGFRKKHILIPLERAHAVLDAETVRVEGMTKEQLEAVPEYALDPETLDADYERRLAAVFGTRSEPPVTTRGFEPPPGDDSALDLQRMEALEDEYQVAGDDPRGWEVVTGDGQTIGKVVELLMDPGAMKARYLDVSVAEKKLELERVDRHILLPANRVRLERSRKRVVVGGLLAGDVGSYPQYGGLPVRERSAWELETFFERVGTESGRAHPDDDSRTGSTPDSTLRHFFRTGSRPRSDTVKGGQNG
jgi:ribosomal 30S subunit maturation factor RimM